MSEQLFDGVVEFQKQDFEAYRELFDDLKNSQNPHTLFIGCSDSRLVPNLITRTLPGELFVVRNVANLVPPHRKTNEYVATTSAIEYAVEMLHVKNIVVCGHSNCGGCSMLFRPKEELDKLPHVKKWLELTSKVRDEVLQVLPDGSPGARQWLAEQMNVIEQIRHLLTYPFIMNPYWEGKLNIYGWYYIIETGEVFNYNLEQNAFELIGEE